jgi:hypothetical protein
MHDLNFVNNLELGYLKGKRDNRRCDAWSEKGSYDMIGTKKLGGEKVEF